MSRACEHTNDWERYIALIEDEEKGHRKFKPAGLACGITKAQSVRLFAVKTVFARFVPEHEDGDTIFTPQAKDWFHIRPSVFGACSIADRCEAAILKEFQKLEMRYWLDSVDYVKLNEDPRAPRQAMQEVA